MKNMPLVSSDPFFDYDILKAATVEVDADQDTLFSYRHAMSAPGQSTSQARALANGFVKFHLMAARFYLCRCDPNRDEALHQFGLALHTIQDSTSPAHHGFQVWYDDTPEALDHVRREDFDPGAGSRLDNATAWLWTFFVCNNPPTPLPSDFFGGLGMDAKP
jgi:hypothetical protein